MKGYAMNEEMVQDIKYRINTVVNRYRETTGRDTYRLKLRYFNNIIDFTELTIFFIALWAFTAIAAIINIPVAWVKLVGFGMLVTLAILTFLTGRFEKVKTWKKDYVSEEDLLYLCENEFLKERVGTALVDGYNLTYTYFDKKIDPYTTYARDHLISQQRQQLIQKVNNVQPTLKSNKD